MIGPYCSFEHSLGLIPLLHMESDEHHDPFQDSSGRASLTLKLGDAPYGPEAGHVGVLNSLARSGLPMPGGVVLMEESHRRFLKSSGLAWDLLASGGETEVQGRALELRRRYRGCALEEVLRGVIRNALAEIGGRTVAVISKDVTCMGLHSIPRVEEAVLRAWISTNGLKRQVEATIQGGEIPLWPVLIQRELHEG